MKGRVPLAFRIIAAVGAMVIAIQVSTMLVLGFFQRRAIERLVYASDGQIVSGRAAQMGQLIEKIRYQLAAFASSAELAAEDRRAVAAFLGSRSSLLPPEAVGFFFAWPDGAILTSAGAAATVSDRDYFAAIMTKKASFAIGAPALSKTLGLPIVVFAQAVDSPSGSRLGLLGFQVKLESLSAIVASIEIGKSGYGWLADGEGLVIAHPDQTAVMSLHLLESDAAGYRGLAELGRRMLESERGSGTWTQPDGRSFVSFYEPVPGSPGWRLGISQMSEEAFASVAEVRRILFLALLAGILLSIGAAIRLARAIASPIRRTGARFRALAEGEADLAQSVVHDGNDEIGDLVRDFNTFLAKLREIVSSLKQAQADLSLIGDSLGESVAGAAEAMDRMGADIGAVRDAGVDQAAGVEETASAVGQIARNIESLDSLISSQAASITEASAAIEEMVGNIGSVSSSVAAMTQEFAGLATSSDEGKTTLERAAERVAQIAAQSQSLLEANEAIASIASSTNLLAMNAAIEAAHAGEAGKGFAVVADEIRKLSETAAEQSKTIGRELELIMGAIGAIVQDSKATEAAFTAVARKIASTDTIVRQVSSAMDEQAEGSRQILEALREMNDITSQVKSGSSEMSAGNRAILEEMERLRSSAFEVKSRVEAMAEGAAGIEANIGTVERMAGDTRSTIHRMEGSIGRFTV